MDQKSKVLDFLYKWAKDKSIPLPYIKPSMVDDLDGFISDLMSEEESRRISLNMDKKLQQAQAAGDNSEQKNS